VCLFLEGDLRYGREGVSKEVFRELDLHNNCILVMTTDMHECMILHLHPRDISLIDR
jgi:hypothetical protein